jgi:ABC-type hemin transport system ATPase subunit
MFTKLHLKNFKAWANTGEINLKPVTMLLGTNSSGKSSIIQSLLLLKQTVQSPDRTIHLNLGGDEVNDLFNFGEFDRVLRDGASPRRFDIGFSFKRPSSERVQLGRYESSYGSTAARAVIIQDLVLEVENTKFRSQRKSKGAYSLQVNDESQPRGSGRDMPYQTVRLKNQQFQ